MIPFSSFPQKSPRECLLALGHRGDGRDSAREQERAQYDHYHDHSGSVLLPLASVGAQVFVALIRIAMLRGPGSLLCFVFENAKHPIFPEHEVFITKRRSPTDAPATIKGVVREMPERRQKPG